MGGLWLIILFLQVPLAVQSKVWKGPYFNNTSHHKPYNFINRVINDHFSTCTVFQIQNGGGQDGPSLSYIPKIKIDLSAGGASVSLILKEREMLKRMQEHCNVFLVTFHDIEPQQTHLNRMANIFQDPHLQVQAHNSYMFIIASKELSSHIIFHQALKVFEHKILVSVSDAGNKDDESNSGLNGSNVQVQIQIFCYFCKNSEAGILQRQSFSEGQSIRNRMDIFPDVTSDLYGKVMKVTAAMALPFVGIVPSKTDPSQWTVEGMQGTIIMAIAQAKNFTLRLENTSKGLTGSKLPNGTWTGTLGEILHERADIGLNAAPTVHRHAIADFSVAAFYGFLVLVSTKPSPVFEWQAVVYPFEVLSWLGICACVTISVLAFRYFLNFQPDPKKRGEAPVIGGSTEEQQKKVTFHKVFYIAFGTLMEQGLPFHYRSTPSRIFAFFWFAFALVATCAYKSKLFSYLTFPTIYTPPSSFYELSISDYSWGLRSLGGVALLFITKSPVSYIRRVGEKMEISMDKYNCMDKTFSPKFTCIIYRAGYDYMSAVRYWKIAQKFYVSDYVTPPVGSSWVLPKHSPLLHPFNKLLYSQFELGLAGKHLERYITKMALLSRAAAQASKDANDVFPMNTNFKRRTVEEKPLQLANVYASFLIMYFGLGISATVLIVEVALYKHGRHNRARDRWTKQMSRVRRQGIQLMRRPLPPKKAVTFVSSRIGTYRKNIKSFKTGK